MKSPQNYHFYSIRTGKNVILLENFQNLQQMVVSTCTCTCTCTPLFCRTIVLHVFSTQAKMIINAVSLEPSFINLKTRPLRFETVINNIFKF